MDYHQVLPEVFVGSCPAGPQDVDWLQQELGVTAVLSLQSDDDHARMALDWDKLERHCRRAKVALRRVPVQDFDQQDLRKHLPNCVRALNQLLRAGHTVYVHCTAGVNRSPSVLITYLHWIQQWDLERAVRHVLKCHPCSPDLEAIRLADADFFAEPADRENRQAE